MVPLSVDLKMFPELPTAKNVSFPKVTSLRIDVVPEVLEVQVVPSEEVKIDPDGPTVTNVLFP